jgi:hypothetical protein
MGVPQDQPLNDVPPKTDDIAALSEAGGEGWELVHITGNRIAYLKRPIEKPAEPAAPILPKRRKRTPSAE